jgi:aminopeptidase
MTDPRVERLAALLADYSLALREGKVLRIDSLDAGSPLVLALYGVALRAGALPYTNVSLSGLGETLLHHGSDEQLTYLSPIQWQEIEHLDALVTIW